MKQYSNIFHIPKSNYFMPKLMNLSNQNLLKKQQKLEIYKKIAILIKINEFLNFSKNNFRLI